MDDLPTPAMFLYCTLLTKNDYFEYNCLFHDPKVDITSILLNVINLEINIMKVILSKSKA